MLDTKENAKIAASEVVEKKQKLAKQMAQERKELEMQVARELELERQRKEDLIRQIRYVVRSGSVQRAVDGCLI